MARVLAALLPPPTRPATTSTTVALPPPRAPALSGEAIAAAGGGAAAGAAGGGGSEAAGAGGGRALRCYALAGVDLLLDEEGGWRLLEFNVNPAAPPPEGCDADFRAHLTRLVAAVAASALANEPRGGFAWPAAVEPAGDGERSE